MTDFAFRNYDAWKLAEPDEPIECPECGINDNEAMGQPWFCDCWMCGNCEAYFPCRPCAKADAAGL